jgi:L-asparaginase II
MSLGETATWVARIVRGGVFESLHCGHVVVADGDGAVVAALGNPRAAVYVRSAIKPLQAGASLSLIEAAGATLSDAAVAIASASHQGRAEQQAQVRDLLAIAGLDEHALQCPAVRPEDLDALVAVRGRSSRLAHNCSGKHAAFLVAQAVAGHDPSTYCSPDSAVQRAVRDEIAIATSEIPSGPAVDGCGAPAWRSSLRGLATGFARLAGATGRHSRVGTAMTNHPQLLGARDGVDVLLMAGDPRIVAKRGAEAVFAAGWRGPGGPLGVAVKVTDGSDRAAGAVVATVLHNLGASVPHEILSPIPLRHDTCGAVLEVTGEVAALLTGRAVTSLPSASA